MKKLMLILMLVVCLAGCKKEPEGHLVVKENGNLRWVDGASETRGIVIEESDNAIEIVGAVALDFEFAETTEAPELVFAEPNELFWTIDTGTSDLFLITDFTMPYDISITLDGGEMLFTTTDGKFDVIYDANECTANAIAFADCMETMMPGYILSMAKKLEGTK